MAILANLWYGFPSRKLTVVGVTGTDGKTTTVGLIYHVLHTAHMRASMISSVGAIINGKTSDLGFHVTTPSSWQLQKFLKKAKGFLVLEVTSHALDQYRVWGVDFTVGVLTNVTHEHLDYHKTYKNYVLTKAKLLRNAKVSVVNRDDNSYKIITNYQLPITNQLITYGIKNNADVTPKSFTFKTKLVGEFNKYNILAAVAACKALGIPDKDIKKGIGTFTPPIGRQEIIHPSAGSGQVEFMVMIDFAHTANAFEQILLTVRPNVKGRLIHVFGSAGKRDYKKRPEMGRISTKYADVIVLTAEDPRGESIEKIMEEITKGIVNSKLKIENRKLLMVPDRQEAIITAIRMAGKGDLVLLTGKSHEQSINYGRGEEPWSEHEAVRNALEIDARR